MEEDDPIAAHERNINFFAIPDGTAEEAADETADGTADETADGTAKGTSSAAVGANLLADSEGREDNACPLTPPEALLKRRNSIIGDSPWKQMKIVQASASSTKAPTAKLSEKLAGVQATRPAVQEFQEDVPLEHIWTQCLTGKTSSVLLLAWQENVQCYSDRRRAGQKVNSFHAWGLTVDSVWAKVSSYGDAAVTFHDFVKKVGQDYCHCRFSSLRHMRKVGGTGGEIGVYAFKVEDGCVFEVNDSHCAKLKQLPVPTISSSFVDFQGMQDTDNDNDDDNAYDDDDDDGLDDDNDEYDGEDISVIILMT